MYRLMGLAHAQLYRAYQHLAVERGQGTVEYVALVLLVAGIFAVVAGAGKGHSTDIVNGITKQIQKTIDHM
jgi:hypothetical protein